MGHALKHLACNIHRKEKLPALRDASIRSLTVMHSGRGRLFPRQSWAGGELPRKDVLDDTITGEVIEWKDLRTVGSGGL